ncbi:cytosolic sulfotransferase 15-like [Chenopodium quinoa]|uniref:cytosolic sulfotransferase 15-like n=1 Tax=Chenopodium quinoa TaxID=63459 RepID=UPI000B76CBF3|nr:cytosolic sulfotransferase 15-like [Chenopodium quinoa]
MDILYFPKEEEEEKEFQGITKNCKELILSLPKVKGWRTPNLYLFQRFWCQPKEIQAIISAQTHFEAHDSDVIIATIPKSGTTWLKALVFAIVNRRRFDVNSIDHPLLRSNPHDLVPFLEYKVYADNQVPNLSNLDSPRLFASHVPYTSNCKVVCICRNPFDTFVSIWHFMTNIRPNNLGPFSLEEAFDMYCMGQVGYGPYWDHMLGYWKESLNSPQKVMFLKYEDLKEDVNLQVTRLAEFLGCLFSAQEKRDHVVEDITKLCSFQNMKNLEVNKDGKSILNFDNKGLFRKGEVGDWVNLLSEEMVERLSQIMDEKLAGTGLEFPNILKS